MTDHVRAQKGQLEHFLLKEGFFNGCKYTPVYKTEQKEKKTIYWRLLMCALQTNRKSDKRNASEIFHWQGITTFDAVKPVI